MYLGCVYQTQTLDRWARVLLETCVELRYSLAVFPPDGKGSPTELVGFGGVAMLYYLCC